MLIAPFPWFGGKRKVAAEVWARFGAVGNYVEPFFGSGAVLLARPDSRGNETMTVEPFVHPPSHLDIEIPLFADKPHVWIQWKGTDVCCDILCSCGNASHYDGYFLYFFRCPCGKVWEVGTFVSIYEVTDGRADGACVQEVESDDDKD
jgi:hypothetical protein